jgi:hypothetical protein
MLKLVRFVICIFKVKNFFIVLISIVASWCCSHCLTGAQGLFLATVERMLLLESLEGKVLPSGCHSICDTESVGVLLNNTYAPCNVP